LRQLVEGVRFIDAMMRSPVEKDLAARELEPMRRLFTKSVVARQDLVAGSVLREDHLTLKKPGTGIPGDRLRELVGRRLSRGVVSGQILEDADIAPLVTSAV
jgi:sialic acid synthase SpsE